MFVKISSKVCTFRRDSFLELRLVQGLPSASLNYLNGVQNWNTLQFADRSPLVAVPFLPKLNKVSTFLPYYSADITLCSFPLPFVCTFSCCKMISCCNDKFSSPRNGRCRVCNGSEVFPWWNKKNKTFEHCWNGSFCFIKLLPQDRS